MYSKQKKKQHERKIISKTIFNCITTESQHDSLFLSIIRRPVLMVNIFRDRPERMPQRIPLWILVHNKMKHWVILIQPNLLYITAVTKYDSIFLWWKSRHKLMYHRCSKLKIVFFSTTFGILIVSPDMISIYHLAAIKPPYIGKSFFPYFLVYYLN